MKRAAFLDRDGVINMDLEYVHKVEDFHFLPGVFEAARQLRGLGFLLIVATNQSGIARGKFTERDFADLNQWMLEKFKHESAPIDAVYHCPHHPDAVVPQFRQDCPCRKPMPGMLIDAARDLDLSLEGSVLFGDRSRDLVAAKAAGVPLRYLIGKHPSTDSHTSMPDGLVTGQFESLLDAVRSNEFQNAAAMASCSR